MSLVEQALKKLQQARDAGQPARQPEHHQPTLSSSARDPLAQTMPTRIVVPQQSLTVNTSALRAAGFLAPDSQERRIANEFRNIKRPLIAQALGRGGQKIQNGRLIMVTSSLPGDGKTFTSLNLALSMAQEMDLSVLLVDSDVAKRHISRMLGVEGERGLMDVLRDETADIDAVVHGTDIPGLNVLPAGKPSENATELLASPRMEQVIKHLGSRADSRIVLFDSPPLLLTSESRALAASVGQIVLVVCAGVTPQRAVFDSLDILGEGKAVSVVLNQADEGRSAEYGYSYYGDTAPEERGSPGARE
ncbi:MAG TPA: XrtA-associated tyrosine autokinase [Steroidobacteraceae bacterium]